MSPIFSVISIAIISNIGMNSVIISIVVVSARVFIPGNHVTFDCNERTYVSGAPCGAKL
jgi:hypothetical protein